MRSLKIFTKLFLSHSGLGLLAIVSLSIIFYSLLSNTLIQRTIDQLSSINILKKDLVENYFFRSQQNLEALQVENKFLTIYNDLKLPVNESHSDLTDIRNLCKLYDFKSMHIFDRHHHQIFSTDKELYPEGLLKSIDSVNSRRTKELHIIDASSFANDSPLLFYYVPILESDSLVGIVLVQENFDKIQKMLLENTGMGNTGESYLVGDDYRMRSASRFLSNHAVQSMTVQTQAVTNSLQHKPGSGLLIDYRGENVLSAFRVIEHKDLRWVIISEIDMQEAMLPIISLRNYFIFITLFIILLTIITTYFISNEIVKPILRLKDIIITISRGVIPNARPGVKDTPADEIGEMEMAIHQLTEGFERTTLFANEIGSGNFHAAFTTLSENDALGLSLISMRDELRGFQEEQLKSARARASALLEGQENERRRIIKELHDGVGQMLTAIRMQVDHLTQGDVMKNDIKLLLNEVIVEVKRISYNVMPQAIVDFGLEAALKGLCDTTQQYAAFEIDFAYVKEYKRKLNFEINIAIFRIVQEGLNNIVKHAGATNATVHIVERYDEIYMVIEDNGKGFDKLEMTNYTGSGLRNIQERVGLLNGSVSIDVKSKQGVSIEIHIPLS